MNANLRTIIWCSILSVLVSSSILAQAGNIFPLPKLYPAGNQPVTYALRDFNGDGKLDALVLNTSFKGTSFGVLLGKGDGTFGALVASPPIQYSIQNPAIGDVNGDGVLDLVVAESAKPGVAHVLLGNGDGSFQETAQYSVGTNYPTRPILSDINGDGHLDIAILESINTSLEVTVLLNRGDGTFQSPQQTGFVFSTGSDLAAGDFNRDGKMDLAVIESNSDGRLLVFSGNGDGTFQPPLVIHFVDFASLPESIVAADLSGDGNFDIAVVTDRGTAVFRGNGDGTFQGEMDYTTGGAFGAASAADFNGDGISDLFVNFQYFAGFNGGGAISVLLNRGDGTFDYGITFQTSITQGGNAVAADLNGDGKADVIAGVPAKNVIAELLSGGNHVFNVPVSYPAHPNRTSGIVAGDFNGDGRPDIASGFCCGGAQVMVQRANGLFSPPKTFGSGDVTSVVAADFNGDHKLDLAITDGTGGLVGVLLGRGDGTFGTESTMTTGGLPSSLVAVDFNGDQKVDLAAVDAFGNVSVLLGNGDGTFRSSVNYPAVANDFPMVSGDFNRDGKIDLAVGGADSVVILFGNGDGSFQPPMTIATGLPIPSAIVSADLNNDGNLDLAVACSGAPSNAYVILGNGDGTFQTPQSFPQKGGLGASMVVADFNKDGNLDLAIGFLSNRSADRSTQLYLGNGDGTFKPGQVVPYSKVVAFAAMAAADFNGDGWPDLAILDYGKAVLTVVTNTAGK